MRRFAAFTTKSILRYTLFAFLIATSCGRSYQRIQKSQSIDTLTFAQLPPVVQGVYQWFTNIEFGSIDSSGKYTWITVDSSISVKYFGVDANADVHELWPYGYYFELNKKKIYLDSPAKGEPFVIDKTHMYWPVDLNLDKRSLEKTPYCRIRWNI
jgi:hypothetical protein